MTTESTEPFLTSPTAPPVATLMPLDAPSAIMATPLQDSVLTIASAPPKTEARPSIDLLTGLRGALALWVELHNFVAYFPSSPDLLAAWPLYSGSVAVSMFFSLSGFVLAYNYGHLPFTTRRETTHFLVKRYARLMPIYWVAQLLSCGYEVNAVKHFGWDAWTVLHWLALALGVNTWLPWPRYELSDRPEVRGMSLLDGSLWTIQTELGFYLLFPALLRLMRRSLGVTSIQQLGCDGPQRTDEQLRVLYRLCAVVAVTSTLPTVIAATAPDTLGAFCYLMPWLRLSEFALGMLICCIYLCLVQSGGCQGWRFSPRAFDCLVLVTALAMALGKFVSYPLLGDEIGYLFLINNPGCFSPLLNLILLLGVCSHSPLAPPQSHGLISYVLTRQAMVRMGVLSFAFYVYGMVPYYYSRGIGASLSDSALVACAGAFGLAVLAHEYVEKPAYRWVVRQLDDNTAAS